MKKYTPIFILILVLLCGSVCMCSHANEQKADTEQLAPWLVETNTQHTPAHTVNVHKATITGSFRGDPVNVPCTIYAVRDSMIIVEFMPFLGIKMYRLEATRTDVKFILKYEREYVSVDYKTLSNYLEPCICLSDLQDYAFGDKCAYTGVLSGDLWKVDLHIKRDSVELNAPVNMNRHSLRGYERADIFQ